MNALAEVSCKERSYEMSKKELESNPPGPQSGTEHYK